MIIQQSLSGGIAEYLELITSTKEKTTQGQEIRSFSIIEKFLKNRNLLQISSKDMDALQKFLIKKSAASTVNRHFVVYKHFFNKCIEWRYLEESPAANIKKKKEKDPIRILWAKREAQYIIKNTTGWFRDTFEFMFETGCRMIEMAHVRKKDVLIFEDAVVLTSKKNSKETRVLPLNKRSKRVLLKRMKLVKDPNDFLFFNDLGFPITRFCMNRKLERVAKKLGVKKKQIICLRHTYATNMCKKKINLETVRKVLGHSQIKTTQRYTQTDFFELKKAVNSV